MRLDFRPFISEIRQTDLQLELLDLIDQPELTRQIFENQRAKQWGELLALVESFTFESQMREIFGNLKKDPIQRGKSPEVPAII